MTYYLADSFDRAGNAVIGQIEFYRCQFRDLSNAIKGAGFDPSGMVIMDCDFDRIYQDNIVTKGNAYVMRNLLSIPFARSGIAETSNGDARDPHGDLYQIFDNNPENYITEVYAAGNYTRWGLRRPGIGGQGLFWSDNDHDPSYDRVYAIANALMCGANRGISSGEAGYPLGRMQIFGNTVLDPRNLAGRSTGVRLYTDGQWTISVRGTISQAFVAESEPFPVRNCLMLGQAANPSAVFPNITDLYTAASRSALMTALTTAAEGTGLGAVAHAAAIDWLTDDPAAVIRWENVPSGADWLDIVDAPIDELYATPLACILNRRASQTVVPSSGVEWRSVDTDGTTEIQTWTSSSGIIEPLQFIQLRKQTAETGATSTLFTCIINGFETGLAVTTEVKEPEEYLITGGYFAAPSDLGMGISRIQFSGKFNFPSLTAFKIFAQSSTGCDLEIYNSRGNVRITVEDSTGTKMLTAAVFAGAVVPIGEWLDLSLDVNHATEQAILTLNGTPYTLGFAASGTGSFQSDRNLSILANPSGISAVPVGTGFADLSVSLNGVAHKAISNTAATANADGWKKGVDFAQGA